MTSIQKLKLHGFKSFPKSTEITFPLGYSTVIGSNGSGKSNIMDAFCFVFGKGSAKGMRAEKSSNLIYWILGVIVIAVIVLFLIFKKKKKGLGGWITT